MKKNGLLAIGVGGWIAGILDITQAITLFGKKVSLLIAAGLLGKGALHGGGAGMYALGLFLHFFIAFSVVTICYAASWKFRFMAEHRLVCGLFYGVFCLTFQQLIRSPSSSARLSCLGSRRSQAPFRQGNTHRPCGIVPAR